MSGLRAFREAYMHADTLSEEEFGDFDVRKLRYYVYWAFFENTVYRSRVHTWSTGYKHQYALYKYIRSLYNPAFRLGDFWQAHLMGGLLDPEAGDGKEEPSALPIIVPPENASNDAALRAAISQLWKWSNFQSRKDIFTLYGAVMGDTALRVVDDKERKKVYLEVIHPGTISDVTVDPFGHVKGYQIEEEREHPDRPGRTVTYTEIAERDGKDVVYATYLDGEPYAWNGVAAEWVVPYGFVPIVLAQHNDVGLDWGWSESHPARSKFHEVDDLSSALSDQIRKTVNVKWFFAGVTKPKTTPTLTGADSSTERPEPGREEMSALYAPAGADAKALVAELNIGETTAYLSMLLERLEEDYPELRYETLRAAQVSGEALREARKPVEEKVTQRRTNYDDAVMRAQQMAVAIGGYRDIFQGFGLESYEAGALDHHIGKRPVFTADPMLDLEMENLLWDTAEQAGKAGVPLTAFLKLQGWTDEQIKEIAENEEYQQKQELRNAALQGFGAMAMREEEGDEGEE